VPTQPLARIRRRPTPHCYETLLRYLMEQSEREKLVQNSILVAVSATTAAPTSVSAEVIPVVSPSAGTKTTTAATTTTTTTTPMDPPLHGPRGAEKTTTVYMDGVFDLFHIGHLRAIEQCASLGDVVVIGVTGDADAALYKRPPILSQQQRVTVIAALRCVHRVICPCPLIVTESFIDEHGIDLVVHGFCDEADADRQAAGQVSAH
jgi:cytidyltransferase-like protein